MSCQSNEQKLLRHEHELSIIYVQVTVHQVSHLISSKSLCHLLIHVDASSVKQVVTVDANDKVKLKKWTYFYK